MQYFVAMVVNRSVMREHQHIDEPSETTVEFQETLASTETIEMRVARKHRSSALLPFVMHMPIEVPLVS